MELMRRGLLAVELSLCGLCGAGYGRLSICPACLRRADAEAARGVGAQKRSILLPREFAD